MKTLLENKGVLAIVAILVLGMFLYSILFKSNALSIPSELPAVAVGDDLLKMHKELQSVVLDQALFSSTGYLFLSDFSTSIPQQATGRSNPFDLIGSE